MSVSVDGFIADQYHSLDWLFEVPHGDDDGSWDAFIGGVGPMVMGATTYEWIQARYPEMLEGPERWREFYDDRPCWVFTHRDLPPLPGVDIHFVSGDVRPVGMLAQRVAEAGRLGYQRILVPPGAVARLESLPPGVSVVELAHLDKALAALEGYARARRP